MLSRRGFFGGAFAVLAMPAIIRTPGLLMPVKPPLIIPSNDWNRYGYRATPAEINKINRAFWHSPRPEGWEIWSRLG